MSQFRVFCSVAGASFRRQLAFRFDVVMSVIASVARVLFAYLIWSAVFDGRQQVGGFTFPELFSYYVIASALTQTDLSGGVARELSDRIRGGTFSRFMLLPVSTRRYFAADSLGASGFYAAAALAGGAAWVLLFRVPFRLTGNPLLLLQAALMAVMGLVVMIQFNYFLGVLSFRFLDIGFFLILKDNLMSFATGTLVPLLFLPDWLVMGMRFLPFYYVTYLPSMLAVGKCSEEAWTGLAVLAGWMLLFFALNRLTYERLRVRYDGVGV